METTARQLFADKQLDESHALLLYLRANGDRVAVYQAPESDSGLPVADYRAPARGVQARSAARPDRDAPQPKSRADSPESRGSKPTRIAMFIGSRVLLLSLAAGVTWTGGNTLVRDIPLVGHHLGWAHEVYNRNPAHDIAATIDGAKKALLIDRH